MISKKRSTWGSDPLQSYAMGRSLYGVRVERPKHELREGPAWLALWAEIVFVSICHQTNWDRLYSHVMNIARRTPEDISPRRLGKLSLDDARALLEGGLEPRALRSKADLRERHRLLLSLGERADLALSDASLTDWAVNGVHLAGASGLYSALETVPAYSEDPLRKKARILAHQLAAFQLVAIEDPENILPAIDYHLIRLYMRTNRIHPLQRNDYDKFSTQRMASEIKVGDIRQAVEEAMYYTAAAAEMRIDQLNHIEWQIARSFCLREDPRCDSGPLEEKPVEESLKKLGITQGGCPLRDLCYARQNPVLRRLQDPSLSKSFY